MAENIKIKHIKLLNVPTRKIQFDIEQYGFNLTGYNPDFSEVTDIFHDHANWLLTFATVIGLFYLLIQKI